LNAYCLAQTLESFFVDPGLESDLAYDSTPE
jgi:hypothetical protein